MAVNHGKISMRQQARNMSDLVKRGRAGGSWGIFPRDVQRDVLAKLCAVVEDGQRSKLRRVESLFMVCWTLAGVGAAVFGGEATLGVVAGAWVAAHAMRWRRPRYTYEVLFAGRMHEDNELRKLLNAHPLPRPAVEYKYTQDLITAVSATFPFEKVPGRALLEADADEWGLSRWIDSNCGPGAASMVGSLARQARHENATIGDLMRILRQVEGVPGDKP